MDMNMLKPQNNEWVKAKCDKDKKDYTKDGSARKTNYVYHGENIGGNHKTLKTTTNSMKETKNENTETKRNGSNTSVSYNLYAEATKKGLVRNDKVSEENATFKIA